MKKIIIPVFLFVLASCNISDDTPADSITFTVSRSNYTSGDTVTAVLQNNSSHQVTYGNPFQVEQNKWGKWKYIGPKLYFTLEAYELSPGETTTYHFALTDSLFPGQPFLEGLCRVTTSVDLQKEDLTVKTQAFGVTVKN